MPHRARYLGLAAAVLLAVAGWLGGAFPHGDLAATPASIAAGPAGPIILCCWVLGTACGAYAWWTLRDRVPSARWALTTAALWAAPFLLVPPMGSRDVYSYACQGYLYANGLNPYESGVAALPCPWLDGVSPIWRDTAAPYGPLFLLLAGLVALVAGDSLTVLLALFRLIAVAGSALVVLGLPVIARRCGAPVGRALWIALAGPLIGAHALAGPHNDALMIGLVVAGLAVAARRRESEAAAGPGVPKVLWWLGAALRDRALGAGLLLGLAVAVKATAVVVVPFAMLLVTTRMAGPSVAGAAVTRPRRGLEGRAAGLVLVGAAGSLLLVTLISGLGFGWVGGLVNTRDLVQFTSPPTAVGMTLTYLGGLVAPHFDAVPIVRGLAMILLILVLALLLRRGWRAGDNAATGRLGAGSDGRAGSGAGRFGAGSGGRAGSGAGRFGPENDSQAAVVLRGAALALAATVVLSPYFHPWYALWALIPLAATTVRTDLVMAASTAASFLVLPDGSGLARFVKFPGAPLMTLLLVVLWLRFARARTPERVPVSQA